MATKIQCILLVARSGGVGAGSALSLGKMGMGRHRSSLLGPEMATTASSLGEGGDPIVVLPGWAGAKVIVAGRHCRHRLIGPD